MSLTLHEDAADSAGGGVVFVAEGARVAEFVTATQRLAVVVGRRRCHPTW
jgi:hypothetical protein